jgi:hypothetical protein
MVDKHLGLIFEPAEGGTMDDPVPIPLILAAIGGWGLRIEAPLRLGVGDGVRSA